MKTKTNLTMNVKDGSVACECANCDWHGPLDECDGVDNIGARLDPGSTVPAGQCPECGALAYLEEQAELAPVVKIARQFLNEWRPQIESDDDINGGDAVDSIGDYVRLFGDAFGAPVHCQNGPAPYLEQPPAITALKAARSFIAGFEGDELQEGISELLKLIDDAIPAEPHKDQNEAIARAHGWERGGDGDGFIFHKETWGIWKAASSWAGSDQEPSGENDRPALYSTWKECCESEELTK